MTWPFGKLEQYHFVAFCSFFPCSLTVFHMCTGVDNEKALKLTNSAVFHKGKRTRAGQQNNLFIFQPDFNVQISPKNATKHPVA